MIKKLVVKQLRSCLPLNYAKGSEHASFNRVELNLLPWLSKKNAHLMKCKLLLRGVCWKKYSRDRGSTVFVFVFKDLGLIATST